MNIEKSISTIKETPRSLSTISEEKLTSICSKCQLVNNSNVESEATKITKMIMSNNKNQLYIFNEKYQKKKEKFQNKFNEKVEVFIKKMNLIDEIPDTDNQYKYIQKIILKFLLNKQVSQTDVLMLSEYEKKIFEEYIRLKKGYFKKDSDYYLKNPSQIKQLKNTKRVEENLKFIFRKLFKFLREVFNKTFKNTLIPFLIPKYRNSIRCDDYAFYGFLFEDSAIRLDTKIEKYFEPSIPKFDSNSDQCSKLVRKTISKLYLKCIKKSDYFMTFLNKFVNQILTQNVKSNIKFKLNHIISEWADSSKNSKKSNEFADKASKLKFSWTIVDIEIAIKHLFEYLGDISD
jgi:hypothetical protein